MPVQLVFPNHNPANSGSSHVYLAGPIRNAPPWHEDAIDYLTRRAEEEGVYLRICCPKRYDELVRKPPEECIVTHLTQWEMHAPFLRQRPWEHFNMRAASHGVGVLFWLPQEGEVIYPDKHYAQMTQFELGEWKVRAQGDSRLRIAIGTDGVYNNELRTIRYDFEDEAPHVPWFNSLEVLCEQALTWVKQGLI